MFHSLPFSGLTLTDRPWFPYICTETSNWQWKTRIQGHHNLWIVLSGIGYLRCDETTYQLSPGEVFVFYPGQQISAFHQGGPRITRFSAHFIPSNLEPPLSEDFTFSLHSRVHANLAQFRQEIDYLIQLSTQTTISSTLLEERIHQLILKLYREHDLHPKAPISPRIAQAIQIFQEDPAHHHNIEKLARKLGFSRSHFDREFTQQVGTSPNKFLLNCRLTTAKRLLENSQLSISEIAHTLNYSDLYFFSRQFKQFIGLSPLQYRKAHL